MTGARDGDAGALTLEAVTIRLAGRVLIDIPRLVVPVGSVVTVMGPSGSGKSTLLGFIAGFTDRAAFKAEGRITAGGEDLGRLPAERRGVGLLFQDDLLFPHLSVAGNLLFGLPREAATRRDERRRLVEEALAAAGLDGFAERDPATLSGGQRARVALLRTLMARPRVLLLDEPFSKLDTALRSEVRAFVFALVRERGLPTLLVTHDGEDARAAAGPVYAIGDDGRLTQA